MRSTDEPGVADGSRFAPVPRSLSQTRRRGHCVGLKAVRDTYASDSRLRIAKDVRVLRANHAAVEVVVPGMREINPCDALIDNRVLMPIDHSPTGELRLLRFLDERNHVALSIVEDLPTQIAKSCGCLVKRVELQSE